MGGGAAAVLGLSGRVCASQQPGRARGSSGRGPHGTAGCRRRQADDCTCGSRRHPAPAAAAAAPTTAPAPAAAAKPTTAAPGQTNVAALRLLMPSSYPLGQINELTEVTPDIEKTIGASTKPLFEILQQYKKDNPTTKLEIEEVKWDTISPKFVTVMQGGGDNLPDLTIINDLNIRELALGGYFLPTQRVHQRRVGRLQPGPVEGRRHGPGQHRGAAPHHRLPLRLLLKEDFNTAGITKPPTTWDEMADVATKLTKADRAGYVWPSGPSVAHADPERVLERLDAGRGSPGPRRQSTVDLRPSAKCSSSTTT